MPSDVTLNTTADINAIINFVNAAGVGVINPEFFYTKQLLDTIRLDADQYVYYKLADTQLITNKADKLQLRRWAPLRAHTIPLAEGTPPITDKASLEKYEIPAFQYGRYMEFTDKVDFAMIDPVISVYTKEYSLVALETLDMLAREAMLAVANPVFAGQAVDAEALTVDSKPTIEDLRLIVLDLKRRLVKPRMGTKYVVIGSPEFFYDLVTDPTVEKYMRINNSTYNVFSDSQIPDMFDLAFQETLATPVGGEFYKQVGGTGPAVKHLRVVSMPTATGTNPAYASIPSTNAAYYTKADGYEIDPRTGQEASFIPQLETWNLEQYNTDKPPAANHGPWQEFNIHHILVLGKDALIRTGISGENAARVYVKPKGSSGVLDPIDQRQSIGFKINSVGFGSARLEAIVDYQCIPVSVG